VVAAALCPPGFAELPGEACLSLPASPAQQVILYLHGMYDPAHPEEEFQQEALLRERAAAHGFALLAPRGRAGLCDWSDALRPWLCWPTRPDQRRIGGELLAQWGPAIVETMRRAQLPGTFRPALLGYSNGGFYAAFIASETRLPLRALAVLHAGSFAGGRIDAARAVPTLLIGAEDDAVQGPQMRALQEALRKAGWPSELRMRAGGHALRAADLDAAIDFFTSPASPRETSPPPH
jgi:predicted esterase